MTDFFYTYLNDLLTAFGDPRKRVFVGYLLAAALLALLWLVVIKKTGLRQGAHTLFNKNVWLSRSARSDYWVFIINKAVMLLLSPLLLTQVALAGALFVWLQEYAGEAWLVAAHWPSWLAALAFTVCFFLLDDFSRYFVHQQMHRWPVLWAFHKVHHSAQSLTPMTVFRTHPVEGILFTLRSVLVQAVIIAGFVFVMGDKADLLTVLGANIFVFVFNVLGSNLRHSHIAIYYWKPLEKIFFSPAQHQIHHSVAEKHWNKNYGVALSIWDRIGGSFHHAERNETLQFGLNSHDETQTNNRHHSLYGLYLLPLAEASIVIRESLQKPCRTLMKKFEKKSFGDSVNEY